MIPSFPWTSYLWSCLFWSGVSLGCLGLSLIHALVHGKWGDFIRPYARAGSAQLRLMAVGLIPFVWGASRLYPWMNPETVAADHLLRHKAAYLNVPFFWARTVGFFLLWMFLAWKIKTVDSPDRRRNWSAVGLLLYALSVTFFSIDWMMSLEPLWASSLYGVMVGIGFILAALALCVVAASLQRGKALSEDATKPVHDLGNLLLAFTMFWAYLAFSQYLIIWSGNLPEEIPWYWHRQNGGWQGWILAIAVFHFVLPFLMLLRRSIKRDLRRLAWVAGLIFVMRGMDTVWLIVPAFTPGRLSFSAWDPVIFLAVSLAWWFGFQRRLRSEVSA